MGRSRRTFRVPGTAAGTPNSAASRSASSSPMSGAPSPRPGTTVPVSTSGKRPTSTTLTLASIGGTVGHLRGEEAHVQRHGSESYYVIGEGLLTESVEGRDATLAIAVTAR